MFVSPFSHSYNQSFISCLCVLSPFLGLEAKCTSVSIRKPSPYTLTFIHNSLSCSSLLALLDTNTNSEAEETSQQVSIGITTKSCPRWACAWCVVHDITWHVRSPYRKRSTPCQDRQYNSSTVTCLPACLPSPPPSRQQHNECINISVMRTYDSCQHLMTSHPSPPALRLHPLRLNTHLEDKTKNYTCEGFWMTCVRV